MIRQETFVRALLDPAAAVPEGLLDPAGRPAGRRFAVYRNNVAVSLTQALETGFPVIRKLLGEANFKGLAGLFLRRHPPESPVLALYGQQMPAFLGTLPQVAHLPYLADVARLELALRESYHAADASPLDAASLASNPAAATGRLRLVLAPSVRTLASPWPILGIWRRNSIAGAAKPAMRAEEVLVTRPAFDPVPVLLPAGGAAFVTALLRGSTVEAAVAAVEDPAGFDLAGALAALVSGGAITAVECEP